MIIIYNKKSAHFIFSTLPNLKFVEFYDDYCYELVNYTGIPSFLKFAQNS